MTAITGRIDVHDLMWAHIRLAWVTNGASAHATPEIVVKAGGNGELLAVLNFAEYKSELLIACQQEYGSEGAAQ